MARAFLYESQKLFSAVAFVFLIHVLDRRFVNEKVGPGVAGQLNAILVVPLDDAVDLFAIVQHDDHGSLGLHLLLIIEIFCVGLFGWWSFLAAGTTAAIAIGAFTPFGGSFCAMFVACE